MERFITECLAKLILERLQLKFYISRVLIHIDALGKWKQLFTKMLYRFCLVRNICKINKNSVTIITQNYNEMIS